MTGLKKRIGVVLVEPVYPGNVGATARAMANMGFDRLLLVNPCELDHPEARKMALGAYPIIENAAVFNSLEEALCGFRFAVATTRREGDLRESSIDPGAMASEVQRLLPENDVAVVFGPEDRGLSNEELTLCQMIATIPSDPVFPSLNLSHAVIIFLWEILRSCNGAGDEHPGRTLADVGKMEDMYRHMETVLTGIGYLHPENPKRMVRVLKKILNRAALDDREVRVVRGILRQLDWYMRSGGPHPAGED